MVNKIKSAIGGLAINKIKSAIGGLAMLASTAALGATTNAPVFTGISILPTNYSHRVQLNIKLAAGDTRSYSVYSCSNLTENTWAKSLSNTNVVNTSPSGRSQNVYVFEPYIESKDKMNYKLKEN